MEFKEIRLAAVKQWYDGLRRVRRQGALSDDYTGSLLCEWQGKCYDEDKHCSLLCSLGDWLDNISDQLTDERFDGVDKQADQEALFRFYTRIMLAVSEVVEDFITVHKQITGAKNKVLAGQNMETGCLPPGALQAFSNYINSVAKHKTEGHNLHVHNHHQQKEFEDFGAVYHDNQISLQALDWKMMNPDTTILVPKLSYLVELLIILNNRFDELLRTAPGYLDQLNALYSGDYLWEKDEVTGKE